MITIKRIKNKINHYLLKRKIIKSNFCFGLNDFEKREEKIIVSMTTFPKRVKNLDLCVKSILLQNTKPDKFIIYLGSDCTKEEKEYLKDKYAKYGVTIKHDETNNYMSHKKYLYSLKEYNKDLVITIDDDLIYPSDMITNLIDYHEKFPNCVCARRVHLIKWNDNRIAKYKTWEVEYEKCTKPSHLLFATTGAGTLFPPNSLPNIAYDFDLIEKYALYADDIWIKCMLVLNKTKVVWAKNNLQMPSVINNSQGNALYKKNVDEGKNDEYIKRIINNFQISKEMFEDVDKL